jgi:hypothetical protein
MKRSTTQITNAGAASEIKFSGSAETVLQNLQTQDVYSAQTVKQNLSDNSTVILNISKREKQGSPGNQSVELILERWTLPNVKNTERELAAKLNTIIEILLLDALQQDGGTELHIKIQKQDSSAKDCQGPAPEWGIHPMFSRS